ncbi:adhesion G-protein coupled receptor D1-like isoform X1 [Styela clava]
MDNPLFVNKQKFSICCCFLLIAAFLTQLCFTQGEAVSAYCHKKDDNSANCSSLINKIQNDSAWIATCKSSYWKILIKFTNLNATNSMCIQMTYKLSCLSPADKQLRKMREEICELSDNGIIRKDATPIITQYKKTINDPISIGNYSSIIWKHGSKAKYLATAFVKPNKSKAKTSLANNVNLYNDFFLSSDLDIILISLMDENGTNVNESVSFNINTQSDKSVAALPSSDRFSKISKVCMFYDTVSTPKRWSDKTCKTIVRNSVTSCQCEHNSAFAVVFSTRNITLPQAVTTASTVIESTSIVFLLVTAVLLGIYRKRMRHFDRVLVQINLCLALLLTHLFFVLSPLAVEVSAICYFMAVGTHFFLVATAVLMVIEGSLMLTKVLFPHAFTDSSSKKKRRIVGFCIAWILPLIYAIVCGVVGNKDGGYIPKIASRKSFENCWIAPDYGKYVVLIPICLALGINLLIATRLGLLVWRMSRSAEKFKPSNLRDQNKASHAAKALRAVVILMPILGIPWILGLLVNIEPLEVVFGSIHVVVNGLQGLLLFIHYALFNEEMRGALKKMWSTSVSALPTVHFVSTSNTSVPSAAKTSKSRSDSQAGLHD